MVDALSLVDLARQARPGTNGRHGTAHVDPRDAYRDVPILQQPTWHHEIAAYFFFGGVSSGSAAIGTLAALFGGERGRALARTAHMVAFLALLPCPPLLIDDLGRPGRFYHMLRVFKPSSPMNLGAWTLTVHGAFTALLAARLLAMSKRLPFLSPLLALLPERLTAAAGLPAALTLGGYTGVLLGTTSVPVWSTSPLLGGLFMASSLTTGTAALRLASTVAGQADAALTPVSLALGGAELATLGAYAATSKGAGKALIGGKAGRLLAGTVAASLASLGLDVLAGRGGRPCRILAGVTTLVGGYLLRESVIQAGHQSAADRDVQLTAMQPSPQAPGWGPVQEGQVPPA